MGFLKKLPALPNFFGSSFDDADYILFMGYANDTWNKESETYLNLYHDTAQYYITYGTSFGKRALAMEGTASPR